MVVNRAQAILIINVAFRVHGAIAFRFCRLFLGTRSSIVFQVSGLFWSQAYPTPVPRTAPMSAADDANPGSRIALPRDRPERIGVYN